MKTTLGIFAVALTLAFAGYAKADPNFGNGGNFYIPGGQFDNHGDYGDNNYGDKHDKHDDKGDKDKDHCCPPPCCHNNPPASVPIPSSAYTGGLGVIAIGITSLVRARRAAKA